MFGCFGSSLWHTDSAFLHGGFSLVGAHVLSSCDAQASLPRSVWDLSSPTRDQTCVTCIGRQILNHWTTREVPPPLSS